MYIILLLMSCVGIIVTITGFITGSEMLTGCGIILISPSYLFIIACIFGWVDFPESPNED